MTTPITLAFDVYGTLFSDISICKAMEQFVGDNARKFTTALREKQIEYSFRRGLMRDYAPFHVCIEDALEYTCYTFDLELKESDKKELLDSYLCLQTFPDVLDALEELKSAGYRMSILSNGHPDDLNKLLQNAKITDYFEDIVSVDEIGSFKPNPEVYELFLKYSGTKKENTWMVSGNTFDFIGAMSYGFKGAYVNRSTDVVFDPWEIDPTVVVENLTELATKIKDNLTQTKS